MERMQLAARRLTLVTLAATLLATLGACGNSVEPLPEFDYGFLSITGRHGDAGGLVAEPLGIFYRSSQLILPTSQLSRDSCAVRPASTSTADSVPHLEPGDSISLQLASGTAYLKPRLSGRLTLFLLPPDSVVTFQSGEQITFGIPGADDGFPGATVSTIAPEAFTLGPIPTEPPAGEPLTVTWAPAGSAQTRMLLFLQYAGLGSTTLDQMVLCSVRDDGSHAIPANLLGGWRAAFQDRRAVIAFRERITVHDVEGATLHVTSTFRVDIPSP